MYGYFKGTIIEISELGLLLEVNNIGYNISMPMGKCYDLGAIGDEVKVYTYTSVREDAINLFGFISHEELSLFKLLISVSGVGPKSGQELLNSFSVDELSKAIVNGDFKLISKAPGVGKKTAERIIIDLKDKIAKFVSGASVSSDSDTNYALSKTVDGFENNKEAKEALEALMSLGYGKTESIMAINGALNTGLEKSEAILRGALMNL